MLRLAQATGRRLGARGTAWCRAAALGGAAMGSAACASVLVAAPAACAPPPPNNVGGVIDSLESIQGALDKMESKVAATAAEREKHSFQAFKMMALTPLDGRYRRHVEPLAKIFSVYGYTKYRTMVEVEYFIELCGVLPELAGFPKDKFEPLRAIYRDFSTEDALKVAAIERVTNHDVKAIEYFLKGHFDRLGGLEEYKEFIHFALTSQDINNSAMPLMIQAALRDVYIPTMKKFIAELTECAHEWDNYPMLARTHGQPATPTRLGKEMMVFVERLATQLEMLERIPNTGKFGGATGSLNAHHVAYPGIDWRRVTNNFYTRIGLTRQQHTTQIEHYDCMAAQFDCIARLNTIAIDLCRDMWTYVSLGYFTQTIVKNEVGSSAMPHKVNPINFENAEGNFGVSTALFAHLARKMPISRMQRDLTDSTVSRNIGVPLGHAVLAIASMRTGFGKMNVNERRLDQDLEDNWAVVAEAMQTILRREGYPKPYEALKALTRTGGPITQSTIREFVAGLNVSEEVKAEMRAVTPQNFTGIAL